MSAVPEVGATQPIEAVPPTTHESEDVQMGNGDISQPTAPVAPAPVPESTEAMDVSAGPSITSALEAMLDDFDPMPALEEFPTVKSENQGSEWILADASSTAQNSTNMQLESQISPVNPSADNSVPAFQSENQETSVPVTNSEIQDDYMPTKPGDDMEMSEDANTKPAETHNTEATALAPEASQEDAEQDDHPEWEVDSSPYESSSDSSSDSDSDSDDSEDEKYELLGIEETARILMKAEGESDDEGDNSGKVGKQMRTKNEVDEQYAPRPEIVITEQMKIEPLGVVEHIVENTVVVKGFTPAEYQVLDSGSILCLGDRTVVGTIAEPLGKVQQPMYLVGFQTVAELAELGLEAGTKLYYPVAHANYVFTSALKNLKGSDASNIHDEEVGADEIEFSDDEKEAEHKRMKKQKRREKNGKQPASGDAPRSGLRNEVKQEDSAGGLDYDDKPKGSSSGGPNYDDGSYRRLTRPPGFGTGAPQPNYKDNRQSEEPKYRDPASGNGGYHGNNSGRGRGGRGGASRGGYNARGGRGGSYNHSDSRNSHSSWNDNSNNTYLHQQHQHQSHSQNYQPPQTQNQSQPHYAPQYLPQPPQQMPQPTASGSYYAPQANASNVAAAPQQQQQQQQPAPFANPGSFLPFPAPPPPNASAASIPPLPQFNVTAAAAALANGQIPLIPGLVLPQQAQPQHQPQNQHQHQYQHQPQYQPQYQHQPVPQQQQQQPALNPGQGQQQPQVNPTLAAAMANPAFMAFLAQASAFAQNQNQNQGGH